MKLSIRIYRLAAGRLLCAGFFMALLVSGCASSGVYHQVDSGQTLYRISRAYGVDEIYLARVNGIADPTHLQVGTRLYIPGATSVKKISPVPKPSSKTTQSVSKPKPKPTVSPKPVVKKEPKIRPKPVSKPVFVSKSNIKLLWPLRGKILRSFGATAKGGGKGLEISAKENSEVKAAAAGQVIYSGDGVKGYGYLIIVQHQDDIYTVYGFNSRNLVNQGDFVSQGEKIALSGVPPGGGKPRLHFEVRKKKKAVNPILYLP